MNAPAWEPSPHGAFDPLSWSCWLWLTLLSAWRHAAQPCDWNPYGYGHGDDLPVPRGTR